MTEASTISRDTSEQKADRRMLIDGQLVETSGTFPADATITTPAANARSIDARNGSSSVPPSEMLMTCAPWSTAQSMPRGTVVVRVALTGRIFALGAIPMTPP